tara:strand:+ start:233 stop:799 length:567 start_codon:yes stop_codon:yes gene_type:complete
MNKERIATVIELAVRINISLKLMIYGIGKIFNGQFYIKGKLPSEVASITLDQVDGYTLAWTFFGYSKGYILFIGLFQLLGALLFLYNRSKIVGAFILLPILLNIIVVDYFFGVAYGALFSAIFYVLGICWVLYRQRERWVPMMGRLLVYRKKTDKWAFTLLLALAVFGIIFYLEYLGIQFFGYEDRKV